MKDRVEEETELEVEGCLWMMNRGNWIGTYHWGSLFEKDGVRSHLHAEPTNPYTELLASHFGGKVLECDFWQMALGTTCPQLAKDSEFAKRSLDYIEQMLGKDVLAEILAPLEEEYMKAFDMAKTLLASPVNCEECGMYFLRKFIEQVACDDCDGEASVCQGCDGEASVCQGCLVCEELDEGALVCEGCLPSDG